MNPCLFQSPAGAASTFEPFRIPVLATLYTAPSRSFGVRLVHREWSYGLSWVSPASGFAFPHPVPLLQQIVICLSRGFRNFVPQFLGLSPFPCGFGRPRASTLVEPCYPPFLGGGAQTLQFLRLRATASCSLSLTLPIGIIPFRWSYSIILQWDCQGVFEDFL